MSAGRGDIDEMHCSLLSIRKRYPNDKITTQLLDIQSSHVPQQKSLEFIQNLECLFFPDSRKRVYGKHWAEKTRLPVLRQTINAFSEPRYVALSYTWHPSPQEDDLRTGGYMVQQRNAGQLEPSPVRNSVFSRIRRYMDYVSAPYLWIDQHCIEQREGKAKEIGMQAMDRVYSLSRYPATLLARPIRSSSELQLLVDILTGQLVHQDEWGFGLSRRTSLHQALEAIELLNEITSDSWFTRGWTFQENYRAGTKMTLLIPHPPALNNEKPYKLLGSLDRELCVNSGDFHEEATKLCLAYQSHQPPRAILSDILARAGKYTIMLQSHDANDDSPSPFSMSPTIIADLTARHLTTNWDRLPIAANCCQYTIRLNSTKLRAEGHSLSLSMLTLCLLNGEILSNNPSDSLDVAAAGASTVAEFLKMQSFDGLQSPSSRRSLTFNKSCRFVDVKLTEEGIQTKGHLWQLDSLIPTKAFPRGSGCRYEAGSSGGLGGGELCLLEQLANELSNRSYEFLSRRLLKFINKSRSVGQPEAFAQKWQVRMAKNVAMAINEGKTLCTARLIHGRQPGCAIFITEEIKYDGTTEESWDGPERETDANGETGWSSHSDSHKPSESNTNEPVLGDSTYVFTALYPGRGGQEMFDSNDIDRHVSMEVDSSDLGGDNELLRLPRLFTKRWIHGLCFFDRCPRQDVIFPWPLSLEDM